MFFATQNENLNRIENFTWSLRDWRVKVQTYIEYGCDKIYLVKSYM